VSVCLLLVIPNHMVLSSYGRLLQRHDYLALRFSAVQSIISMKIRCLSEFVIWKMRLAESMIWEAEK